MTEQSRAVAVQDQAADSGVLTLALTLDQAKKRVDELQKFVQAVMVHGIDYGTIPNTPKPTLFKAGAEKLCEVYALAPQVSVTARMEDWENGFFAYEVKVTLISKRTGVLIAEGIGSCNSKEKRYRNQDQFSIVNTVLKMAKKRALVDAVLSATRSSGLFSQDLEDLADDDEDGPAAPRKPAPRMPTGAPRQAAQRPRTARDEIMADVDRIGDEQREGTGAPASILLRQQAVTPICADCEQEIPSLQVGSNTYTPTEVAASSRKKFGRFLCHDCGKKEAARRENPANPPAPEPVQGEVVDEPEEDERDRAF